MVTETMSETYVTYKYNMNMTAKMTAKKDTCPNAMDS